MNDASFASKILAAAAGAYSGTIIASGITTLFGGQLHTSAWWDWIAYSILWGTIISLPVSIIFMFSVVRLVLRLFARNNRSSYRQYVLAGLISGSSPVLLGYAVTLLYSLLVGASFKEISSTLVPFSYLLLNAVLCGTLSLIVLYKISFSKSLNLASAKKSPAE